jgi:outer membrane protein
MSTYLRSVPFLALSLCGLMLTQPAHAEMKIGVVNFQKLFEEAPQTKSMQLSLQNEFGPRQRELVTMQNDLKSRQDKLEKEAALMTEADRVKAEKTLRDEQREFSRKGGEFQDDLSTRRNEEIGRIQRYLQQEVQTYSSAQGFDLVLVETLYAKPALDITPQILEILKTRPATLPPGAGAAPAKAPAAAPQPKPPASK